MCCAITTPTWNKKFLETFSYLKKKIDVTNSHTYILKIGKKLLGYTKWSREKYTPKGNSNTKENEEIKIMGNWGAFMYKYEIEERCFHKKLGIESAPAEELALFVIKSISKGLRAMFVRVLMNENC